MIVVRKVPTKKVNKMARATATLAVSLGLVTMNVKLYLTASTDDSVSMHLINQDTGNRVKQVYIDANDYDETKKAPKKSNVNVVPFDKLIKGYEHTKGKYVTFTQEEVKQLGLKKQDTLDLVSFVPVNDINPLHVEKTYYLSPDKGAANAYVLLHKILSDMKLAAVGTWVSSRGRDHLMVIRPYEKILIIHQMFFESEIRSFDQKVPDVKIDPVKYVLSKKLIEGFVTDRFNIGKFRDTYVDRVKAAVEAKLKGDNIVEAANNPEETVSTSEIEELRKSLKLTGMSDKEIDELIAKAS